MKKYLTITEWAKREGYSRQAAHYQCRRGRVRTEMIGNRIVIPVDQRWPEKADK